MTVKEIIKLSATLLGREDIKSYVDGREFASDSDTKRAVDNMIELLNLVVNELCVTYVPMIKTEKVQSINGKVEYKNLSERPIKIYQALDFNGEKLSFNAKPLYLTTSNDVKSVEYSFIPEQYGYEDQIGYTEKDISIRALAFGLCSEFCIVEGEFDKAVVWHERYIDAIKEVCFPKNGRCKQRSWY